MSLGSQYAFFSGLVLLFFSLWSCLLDKLVIKFFPEIEEGQIWATTNLILYCILLAYLIILEVTVGPSCEASFYGWVTCVGSWNH